MRHWLPALIGMLTCVALTSPTSSAPPKSPEQLRLEVRVSPWHVTGWNEPIYNRILRTDTRFVVARPGDDIVDTTLYRELLAPGPRWLSPLTLGTILAPDRAWVRMTHAGIGGVYSFPEYPDSVLISTSWRTFDTRSVDAGTVIRVRVVSDTSSLVAPGDDALQVRSRSRGSAEADLLRWADVVGLFRLLRVTRTEVPTTRDSITNFALRFRAEDVWQGSAIRAGDTLTAMVDLGEGTDSTWTGDRRGTPMRVGHGVVLFLYEEANGSRGKWGFNPLGGYGLLDESERLVFCYPIRGEPIDRFRRRIEWAAWPAAHRFEGRVFGRVFADSTSRALRGAQVRLSGVDRTGTVDSTGWFELIGVPIGRRLLRVTGACRPASTIVEVSDEHADTLEVRVPCESEGRR